MWPSQRRPRPRQLQPALRLFLALPIAALLLHTDTSTASAAASSGPGRHRTRDDIINDLSGDLRSKINNGDYTKRPMRIVLAGPNDPKKAAFCRFLRLSLRSSNMEFPAQASVDILYEKAPSSSDNKYVTTYTETLFGGGSIEIYDTPDFFDVEDAPRDMERMKEIQETLNSLDYVDAVLFYFGRSFCDFSYSRQEYVQAQLSAVFPKSLYANIALVENNGFVYFREFNSGFQFSEESLKSRCFAFRNSPANVLNRYQQSQTIASLFRDSSSNLFGYSRGDFDNYKQDMKDLTRLFAYFTSNPRVGRCNNPGFSAMWSSLSMISEYLSRILSTRNHPNLYAMPTMRRCVSSLRSLLESLPIDYTEYLRVIKRHLHNHIARRREVGPRIQLFPSSYKNQQRDHLTRNLEVLERRLKVVESELSALESLPKDHQNSAGKYTYSVCAIAFILYIVVFPRHCSFAKRFEALLRSDRRFMIVSRSHDLVYFRLMCENLDDGNEINQRLIDAINSQGDVFLLQSKFDNRVAIRFEFFSPFASNKDAEAAFSSIQTATTTFLRNRRM